MSLTELVLITSQDKTGAYEWRCVRGSDIRIDHMQLRLLYGHTVRIEPDELYGSRCVISARRADQLPMYAYLPMTPKHWQEFAEQGYVVPREGVTGSKIIMLPVPPGHPSMPIPATRYAADKSKMILACICLRAYVRESNVVAYSKRGLFECWNPISLSDCQFAVDTSSGKVKYLRHYKSVILTPYETFEKPGTRKEVQAFQEQRHNLRFPSDELCPICLNEVFWGLYECKCGAPIIPPRGFMIWAMQESAAELRSSYQGFKKRTTVDRIADCGDVESRAAEDRTAGCGGGKGKTKPKGPRLSNENRGSQMNPGWLRDVSAAYSPAPFTVEEFKLVTSLVRQGDIAQKLKAAGTYKFWVSMKERTNAPMKQGKHRDERLDAQLKKESASGRNLEEYQATDQTKPRPAKSLGGQHAESFGKE